MSVGRASYTGSEDSRAQLAGTVTPSGATPGVTPGLLPGAYFQRLNVNRAISKST